MPTGASRYLGAVEHIYELLIYNRVGKKIFHTLLKSLASLKPSFFIFWLLRKFSKGKCYYPGYFIVYMWTEWSAGPSPTYSGVKEFLHTLYMRSRQCHTENDAAAFPYGQAVLAFVIIFCPHSTPLCEACEQRTSISLLPMAVHDPAVPCQRFCLGVGRELEKPRDWKGCTWAARAGWWGENWEFASSAKAASQKWVTLSCILLPCFPSAPGCDQLLFHWAAGRGYG